MTPDFELIRKLWKQGKSLKEIARETKVSPSRVWGVVTTDGLGRRKKRRA